MSQEMQIAWQKTSASDGVRILRVYSHSPEIMIPDRIAGLPVKEIGAYCFSSSEKQAKGETFLSDFDAFLQESNTSAFSQNNLKFSPACGNFISELTIPDSVTILHNAAFYNCRKLSRLSFGPCICGIGSDEFTNCQKLKYLNIRADIGAPTALKTILERIETELFVSFSDANGILSSELYFPEYYEWLDEISPAHIFSRSIHGEGYRMRKSFDDRILNYAKYDDCFHSALNNETDASIINIALFRLLYPNKLEDAAKELYQKALSDRSTLAFSNIIKDRHSDMLLFLLRQLCHDSSDFTPVLLSCSEAGWAEGAALVMEAQQKLSKRKPKTFSFD